MRGNSYTVRYSLSEVTIRSLEQSAGTALEKEALTEATTPGSGYMQRCQDNMRSVLGTLTPQDQHGILLAICGKTEKL